MKISKEFYDSGYNIRINSLEFINSVKYFLKLIEDTGKIISDFEIPDITGKLPFNRRKKIFRKDGTPHDKDFIENFRKS